MRDRRQHSKFKRCWWLCAACGPGTSHFSAHQTVSMSFFSSLLSQPPNIKIHEFLLCACLSLSLSHSSSSSCRRCVDGSVAIRNINKHFLMLLIKKMRTKWTCLRRNKLIVVRVAIQRVQSAETLPVSAQKPTRRTFTISVFFEEKSPTKSIAIPNDHVSFMYAISSAHRPVQRIQMKRKKFPI